MDTLSSQFLSLANADKPAVKSTLPMSDKDSVHEAKLHGAQNERDAASWQAAQDFEAAFISQMLTFSGFGKALTMSGGEDVASFSQFYIEAIAKDITEGGGFGLAEKIYSHIEKKETKNGNLGRL
ncbi:MAG: hypothetical protein COA43_11945 [Robiginitomaculum sp.]|nr:MAG: hypothetical protein COA43_11945 [Robiginitomaculum sp.]